MCTTACMQVGFAIMCRKIRLDEAHQAATRGDAAACDAVTRDIEACMRSSSVIQGRLQLIMQAKDSGRGVHDARNMPYSASAPTRMMSVNELVCALDIDLEAVGVGVEELVVCRQGIPTRCEVRSPPPSSQHQPALQPCMLAFQSESVFVGLGHVPVCMVVASGSDATVCEDRASVCTVTANSHTVCGACYYDGAVGRVMYAVFDPLPGCLWVGLSAEGMVRCIRRQLGVPAEAVGNCVAVMEGIGASARRHGTAQPVNKRKRNRPVDERASIAQRNEDGECNFYGDVTIMYLKM